MVVPSTRYFWPTKYTMMGGIMLTTDMAMIWFQLTALCASSDIFSASEMGYSFTLLMYSNWFKKSFHSHMNWKMPAENSAGAHSGAMIFVSVCHMLQPSMYAASSRSRGMPRMN